MNENIQKLFDELATKANSADAVNKAEVQTLYAEIKSLQDKQVEQEAAIEAATEALARKSTTKSQTVDASDDLRVAQFAFVKGRHAVTDGDILDHLVVAEHDARLDRDAAIDTHHLGFVVQHFDEASILRGGWAGHQREGERGNKRADHAVFSMDRSRAFGAADLNRLPMPEPRARAELMGDDGAGPEEVA